MKTTIFEQSKSYYAEKAAAGVCFTFGAVALGASVAVTKLGFDTGGYGAFAAGAALGVLGVDSVYMGAVFEELSKEERYGPPTEYLE